MALSAEFEIDNSHKITVTFEQNNNIKILICLSCFPYYIVFIIS